MTAQIDTIYILSHPDIDLSEIPRSVLISAVRSINTRMTLRYLASKEIYVVEGEDYGKDNTSDENLLLRIRVELIARERK